MNLDTPEGRIAYFDSLLTGEVEKAVRPFHIPRHSEHGIIQLVRRAKVRKTYQELMHDAVAIYRECAALLVEKEQHEKAATTMVRLFGDYKGNIERDFQLQMADTKRRRADKLKKKARRITRRALKLKRKSRG